MLVWRPQFEQVAATAWPFRQALEIEFPLQAVAYRLQLLQGWPAVAAPAASTTSKQRAAAAPGAAAEPDAKRRRRAELEKYFDIEAEGEDDGAADSDAAISEMRDVDDLGNLAGLVADSDEDAGGFDDLGAPAARRAVLMDCGLLDDEVSADNDWGKGKAAAARPLGSAKRPGDPRAALLALGPSAAAPTAAPLPLSGPRRLPPGKIAAKDAELLYGLPAAASSLASGPLEGVRALEGTVRLAGLWRLPRGKVAARVAETVYGLPPPPLAAASAAARRRLRPSEVCLGHGSGPCVWSLARPGQPARAQRGQQKCVFCDLAQLQRLAAKKRNPLAATFRRLRKVNPAAEKAALARVAAAAGPEAARKLEIARPAFCEGRAGTPCSWSLSQAGARARLPRGGQVPQCLLCGGGQLLRQAAEAKGGELRTALQMLKKSNAAAVPAALALIEEAAGEAATAKYEDFLPLGVAWERALARRRSVMAEPNEVDKGNYRERSRDDRRRRDKKFPGVFADDSSKWLSELGLAFENWALRGSWSMCRTCNRLEKRPFHPIDVKTPDKSHVWTKACKHCKSGVGYPVAQPDDVPRPLRGLSGEILAALRPLDIFCGPYERATDGYRIHTSVVRFRWAAQTVEAKTRALASKGGRRKAAAALQWLLEHDGSSMYKAIHDKHLGFLQELARNGVADLTPAALRLPLNVIESVGIECAVWPHLYWETSMCETFVRSQDARRQERLQALGPQRAPLPQRGPLPSAAAAPLGRPLRRRPAAAHAPESAGASLDEGSGSESADVDEREGEGGEEGKGRQSCKASYLAKVLGPIVDYGADHELAQFVYDLWLWSALGGCKNATRGMPLRAALAARPFSPEYWKTKPGAPAVASKRLQLALQSSLSLWGCALGPPEARGVAGSSAAAGLPHAFPHGCPLRVGLPLPRGGRAGHAAAMPEPASPASS